MLVACWNPGVKAWQKRRSALQAGVTCAVTGGCNTACGLAAPLWAVTGWPVSHSHDLHCCRCACREARDHGISSVGLPSRLAAFRALPLPQLAEQVQQPARLRGGGGDGGAAKGTSWWDLPHRRAARGGGERGAAAPGAGSATAAVELCNTEPARGRAGRAARGLAGPVCCLEMPRLKPAWAPKIQMFLPSFR